MFADSAFAWKVRMATRAAGKQDAIINDLEKPVLAAPFSFESKDAHVSGGDLGWAWLGVSVLGD
jgi:hypothetical protein